MTNTHDTAQPYRDADAAAAAIRSASGLERIDLSLTLGSGWSGAADLIGDEVWSAPAHSIPGFSRPAVDGHTGMLRAIRVTGTDAIALVLGARTHLYEGRGVPAVVHGVRTAAALGARTAILTNGCGGLNRDWRPGTAVLIRDHINFSGATPLVGATFLDQTEAYSQRLRSLAHRIDPSLPEGVYMQFHGPTYETPAEVRMAGVVGADLVGMSTVLETIAAREAGMEVLGMSLVTNLAAGISPEPLSHQEVIEAGRAAAPRLADLLSKITVGIAEAGPTTEERTA
ncbi:purine-nucleoside phosphorylase [Helcobacillus massiliensis]|uniref:Purine nucleoside phosphorylase n=1 Tax=Helcobacillus massiliensis TaxID=521392 RepID=A0A839QT61_9MICO|nr:MULTISPECIES: purine-nucleoside phosphorylase [Helcobacillus]MBB3021940.1 purine-nucleoside phosphorylase [Helcobacillus massiliensis]MCG7427491.1 purine-nucleoside phosphorylase [Helcobacillus sp. ACRRO]MCT1557505.1 purine-nucleoside phosphorylase [Helcobacillus massiliensis]MCT2036314.1 purine-nucleoside phosphorylase [Helcobacillus massiliensis]MCT2331944.1 purine-nucleoside phosphorylase [Helcobacillus massiliensis]